MQRCKSKCLYILNDRNDTCTMRIHRAPPTTFSVLIYNCTKQLEYSSVQGDFLFKFVCAVLSLKVNYSLYMIYKITYVIV